MSAQPQDVQAILKRIDVLGRQNRWLIRAGLVGSLVAVAIVTMGQTRTSHTVEAEQFILRDAHGRQRLTIGFYGGIKSDEPAIWIAGPTGVDQTIFASQRLVWFNEQGKVTARIEGNDNGGSGPTIEFRDPKQGDFSKDTLFLAAGRLEMNAPSDLRAGLKADPDLDPFGPHIFLDDKDGVTRVSLGLKHNRPSLVIGDTQGFHAQLGSADLEAQYVPNSRI